MSRSSNKPTSLKCSKAGNVTLMRASQSGCRGWRRSCAVALSMRPMYVRTASPCARRGTTKWRSSGRELLRSSTIRSPPCASTAASNRSTADSRSTRSSGCSPPVTVMPRLRNLAATSAAAAARSLWSSSLAMPMLPLPSIFRETVVRITIEPPLPRLLGSDHGVSGRPRMLGGMLVGRAVAAQRRAALLAGAQMHPLRLDLHALGALPALGMSHGGDRLEVNAARVGHRAPRLFVQHLVDGGDRDRSLPDGGRRPLDAPAPDVAHREHAGQARFQEMRRPGQRPVRGGQILRGQIRARLDEATGIEREAALEPRGTGSGARHGKDVADALRLLPARLVVP